MQSRQSFTNGFGQPRGPHVVRSDVTIQDTKGTLLRIWSYLATRKLPLVFVFLLTFITTLVTIIGARLNGVVIDTYIAKGDLRGLAIVCLLMVAMYVINSLATYGQNSIMIHVAQKTSATIRRDVYTNMQQLPLPYFDQHDSGDLMSRLTNDVDNINTALTQNVTQLFTSIITVIGMLISMLILSPLLTIVALIASVATFFFSRTIARLTQKYYVTQQAKLGKLNSYAEETISGQKVQQLFRRDKIVMQQFEKLNDSYVADAYRSQALSSMIGPLSNMVNNFAYLLVTVVGAVSIVNHFSAITVGIIFSFLIYMKNFTNPIRDLLNLFNTLQLAIASAERVFEVVDEQTEHDQANSQSLDHIDGDIELKNVEFSYLPGKKILKGLNISAYSGETFAIVGPTGAGKSTIINLLNKFYQIDSGEILIDGKNIDAITRSSLRRLISIVQQDTFLFSATIRENIRYGNLAATDEAIEAAAKETGAHDFINQMPNGYDTILSDNGQNLSQGQRQLLSISRAIISNASVLILDEATSSIDTNTEIQIQKAMLALMKGKTSFVIAHRLSTIKTADTILVIDQGQVVEQGNHEELLAKKGFYYELYMSQFNTGLSL